MTVAPPFPRPLRLLVVDDDLVDREAIRRAVRHSDPDAELCEVERADVAVEELGQRTIDCVLCDLRMPGHDGRWFLDELRRRRIDVPTIMLTGHGDEETAVEVLKLGAADYIPKATLTAERLQRSLRSTLRIDAAERDARAAQDALRRQVERMRQLAAVAPELDVSMGLDAMLRIIAMRAKELLDVRSVLVTLDGGQAATAGDAPPDDSPSAEASLSDRTGASIGSMRAVGPTRGAFDDSDQAMLAQLVQLTSVAISNLRYFAEAREAARAREETLAVVSHDLRNPLTALRLILSGAANPEANARALGAVTRMDNLIRDLLDVARIDAGHFAVDSKPYDPTALVREAVELMRPLAEKRNLELRAVCAEVLPRVLADEPRVARVIENLLANAIRFSNSGVVEISAEETRGFVRFGVSDSGPGIAMSAMPKIFDRFYRERQERDGAGLGLAIAKGIVEAHGGTIWAYNRANGGATFYFTLPIAEGDATAAA